MRGSWRGRDAGSADKVTALHAAASWLIVGRASGAVQSYALPSLQYSGLAAAYPARNVLHQQSIV